GNAPSPAKRGKHELEQLIRVDEAATGPTDQGWPHPSSARPSVPRNQCAREDSNLHGPYSPQGPQPCASTNSATGAWAASIAPLEHRKAPFYGVRSRSAVPAARPSISP